MHINFNLKNPKGDGDTLIYCTINYQNNRVRIYTDKKINPKFWNLKTQRVRSDKGFTQSTDYNAWLANIAGFVTQKDLDWKNKYRGKEKVPPMPINVLKESLRQYLSKTTKEERKEIENRSFWGYFDTFVSRMENGTRLHLRKDTRMSPKTIAHFHNLKRHLLNFEKKKSLRMDFETIDLGFYKKWIDYLTITLKLAPNTIGKLTTNLKVFLREALEDGMTANNVFTHRKFKSIARECDTVYLNTDEIKELQSLDLAATPRLDRVRDMFVIACYTGLRFSDLVQIRQSNIEDGMVEITQTKTGDTIFVPLIKDVLTILAKYEKGIPKISNQKYNDYLHEVCEKCEVLQKEISIKETKGGKEFILTKPKYTFISSHTARRSFATNEYKAGELSISEIMAITGHKAEKTFNKYIRETPKDTAKRIKQKFADREIKLATMQTHLKAV